jgi:hypothetical protein
MSLALAVCNKNGIVVSTDVCTTITLTDPDTNKIVEEWHDNFAQKSYLTKQGHAVAFTGAGELDNKQKTHMVILDLLKISDMMLMSVKEELDFLLQELSARTSKNIVYLIDAAIEDGNNVILYTDTSSKIVHPNIGIDYAVASGMHDVYAEEFHKGNYDISNMDFSNMVDFVKKMTSLTAKKYDSVSEEIDLIVIDDTESYRVTEIPRQPYIVDP